MSAVALEVILGFVFGILGMGLLMRYKKLTRSNYYRILFIVTALILIFFGVYLGYIGIFLNE
ncbi:hypothetical protein [Constantimarinum furrinae]|uniref:Uncharacterized protein n=1 Tax=Constantimarinum furrinae TaxID=2562285 RepID=A0A7G8PVP6_9FLAO|nr:hypothetical protein [Constantimarinum furrinae]QNJ98412.1 hypothetical protein ALE3EI_1864 [Constantimarinum furrinae]